MGAFEQAPLLFFSVVFVVGMAGGYVGSRLANFTRKILNG